MFLLQFDNIMMEESAQILEIETFIPLLLQVITHFKSVYILFTKIGDIQILKIIALNKLMAFT